MTTTQEYRDRMWRKPLRPLCPRAQVEPAPCDLDGVLQQILHTEVGPAGDCTRAALATVLGKPIEAVPHFADYYPGYNDTPDPGFEAGYGAMWYRACRRWLRSEYGRDLASYDMSDGLREWMAANLPADTLALGTVPSPRGPFTHHVVIDRDCRIVWDPHPDQDAYGLELTWVELICDPFDDLWLDPDPEAARQLTHALFAGDDTGADRCTRDGCGEPLADHDFGAFCP